MPLLSMFKALPAVAAAGALAAVSGAGYLLTQQQVRRRAPQKRGRARGGEAADYSSDCQGSRRQLEPWKWTGRKPGKRGCLG